MTTAVPSARNAPVTQRAFAIRGMHCPSCVAKIEAALQGVEGVASAHVTLQPPQAIVEMQRSIPSGELGNAVAAVGEYTLMEAHAPVAASVLDQPDQSRESLYPLLLIVSYILGTVFLIALATNHWSAHAMMNHFMGGFFIVFSFFKLLDLRGFATAYRSYDIVARATPIWGFAYPFIELALGAAYITGWQPVAVNVATLLIMLVGAVGVLKALMHKRAIRCACLGTVLNLPMTKVTLVEDLGMALMAATMLTGLI